MFRMILPCWLHSEFSFRTDLLTRKYRLFELKFMDLHISSSGGGKLLGCSDRRVFFALLFSFFHQFKCNRSYYNKVFSFYLYDFFSVLVSVFSNKSIFKMFLGFCAFILIRTAEKWTGNGRRGNNMQQRATGLNQTQATAARTKPLYMWHLLYQLNNQGAPQIKVIFIKRVLGCGCRAACSCGAETLSCKKSFSACGLDLHTTCMPWFSCSQVSRIIKSHKPPVLLSNKVVLCSSNNRKSICGRQC